MSHASTTFKAVEEAMVARIVALDASAFTHGGVPACWHESKSPLSVMVDASTIAHLSFNVWIQSAPNTNDNRGMTWQDNDVDNDVEIDALMKVAFAFELRSFDQVSDTRDASDAAIDVIRALMAEWTADDQVASGAVLLRLLNGYQTGMTLDGQWMLVTQDYIASFDLDLLG